MNNNGLAWRKILVGVDGSEYAERALEQAIEIAKRFSAEITVVNVYHSPSGQETSQKFLEKAKKMLEKTDVKFKAVSDLSVNTPKFINDMAEDENFDLIVVGSRGMGAIKAFLIGSLQQNMLRLANQRPYREISNISEKRIWLKEERLALDSLKSI